MRSFLVFEKLKLKFDPFFKPKLVALIIISKFLISFSRSFQEIIFKNLNFFFKKIHFSLVLLVIKIFLIPDFLIDKITDGETPPAPIIKAFLFELLSISFK